MCVCIFQYDCKSEFLCRVLRKSTLKRQISTPKTLAYNEQAPVMHTYDISNGLELNTKNQIKSLETVRCMTEDVVRSPYLTSGTLTTGCASARHVNRDLGSARAPGMPCRE